MADEGAQRPSTTAPGTSEASAPTGPAPLASASVRTRRMGAYAPWALAVCLAALSLGTFAVISAGSGARTGGDPADIIEMSAPQAQIVTADAATSTAEDASAAQQQPSPAPAATPVTPQDVDGAGFAVSDERQVWADETSVELFSSSYINAAGQTTVASADGSKLVAPGTSGAYTFALRNTGTVPLTYRVWVEVSQDAGSLVIPLDMRLTAGQGKTRTVDEAAASALPGLADEGQLASRTTALYTLSWIWPFDADDARDTALGQAAAGRDLTCTVTIHAQAVADTSGSGADAGNCQAGVPKTADFTIDPSPLAAAGASLALAGALALRSRGRRRTSREGRR